MLVPIKAIISNNNFHLIRYSLHFFGKREYAYLSTTGKTHPCTLVQCKVWQVMLMSGELISFSSMSSDRDPLINSDISYLIGNKLNFDSE